VTAPAAGASAGELPWPLRYIIDGKGRDTGFCFVRGPIGGHGDAYETLRDRYRWLGLTSLGPYPLCHEAYDFTSPTADPTDGWKRPFVSACEAWAHCFRQPGRYLPPGADWELLSGSDFTDSERVWHIAGEAGRPAKRWDLVYSCLGNRFNEVQKNWDFAKSCLRRLCSTGRFKVLLVGRADSPDVPRLPGIEAYEFLPWREFLAALSRSRAAFFPNALDASPRVLTEALSLDIPVLVNEAILGGWKYVTPESGAFFKSEDDVLAQAVDLLARDLRPRDWYLANFGPRRAEEKLAALLRKLSAAGSARSPGADAERARFVGKLSDRPV
jgi:hypothetical protein